MRRHRQTFPRNPIPRWKGMERRLRRRWLARVRSYRYPVARAIERLSEFAPLTLDISSEISGSRRSRRALLSPLQLPRRRRRSLSDDSRSAFLLATARTTSPDFHHFAPD